MKKRAVAAGVLIVLVAVALLVVVWPGDSAGRTDRILDVYAQQLGLTAEEAREQEADALRVADFYCSIEPENLIEVMQSSTSPVEDAIKYAEAACPKTAREFQAVVDAQEPTEMTEAPIRADLVVTLEPDLPTDEIRALGFAILAIDGVADVQGDPTELNVELDADADAQEVMTKIRALRHVAEVEPGSS